MISKENVGNGVVLVTFILPAEIKAEHAYLVGDFNGWQEDVTVMHIWSDNTFRVTLKLEPGKEYQFRYLINGTEWHNDWHADKYVPNPFIGDNSVVCT